MSSKKFVALFEYLRKTPHKLIIPQIVENELTEHFRRDVVSLRELQGSFIHDTDKLLKTAISRKDIDEDAELKKYIKFLEKFYENNPVERALHNSDFFLEIVERAVRRRAPFVKGEKPDYGFKDAVLWHHVREIAHKGHEALAFISANTSQFANASKDDLNPELRAELSRSNTTFKYFTTLESFLEKYGAPLQGITHEAVKKALDLKALEMKETGAFKEEFLKEIFEYALYKSVQQIEFERLELSNFFVSAMDKKSYFLEAVGSAFAWVLIWDPTTEPYPDELRTTFKATLRFDRKTSELVADSISIDKYDIPF